MPDPSCEGGRVRVGRRQEELDRFEVAPTGAPASERHTRVVHEPGRSSDHLQSKRRAQWLPAVRATIAHLPRTTASPFRPGEAQRAQRDRSGHDRRTAGDLAPPPPSRPPFSPMEARPGSGRLNSVPRAGLPRLRRSWATYRPRPATLTCGGRPGSGAWGLASTREGGRASWRPVQVARSWGRERPAITAVICRLALTDDIL